MARALHNHISQSFARARWGLHKPTEARAARVERRWRLPLLLALAGTVPAFYFELLEAGSSSLAGIAYAAGAVACAAALAHTARHTRDPWGHVAANPADLLLIAGLLVAALLPASRVSPAALAFRLAVSGIVLLRMVWALQHLITRGGLAYLLMLSLSVLAMCGAGFWWLEPSVHSFGDGLWLAFTTAATVGYGDIVPTTAAAKIFAVFVVLLGFGVLSTVTAAIAAAWVETEERRIEREILRDMRTELASVRRELSALRAEVRSATHLLAERHAAAPRESGSEGQAV